MNAGWLSRTVGRIFGKPRKRRIEVRFVPYSEGDRLVREGWTLAPEEDHNKVFGMVWLELLEDPATREAAG